MALENSVSKAQINGPAKRMAYTIFLNGQQLSLCVRDYLARQHVICSQHVASISISVSDGMTGIVDYGGYDSYLETSSGVRYPITQEVIFDAIGDLPEIGAGRREASGITFDLVGGGAESATEFPVESCVAYVLITKKHEDITEDDLPRFLQQMFHIHTVDSCWFWNRDGAPAARAIRRLVESEQGAALASFIANVDPYNSMVHRSQLIDVGWQLINHHHDWLVRNGNVLFALRQRSDGLTGPLCAKLESLAGAVS